MAKGLARILLTLGSQCEEMKAAALQTRAKSLRKFRVIVFSGLAQSALANSRRCSYPPNQMAVSGYDPKLEEHRRASQGDYYNDGGLMKYQGCHRHVCFVPKADGDRLGIFGACHFI